MQTKENLLAMIIAFQCFSEKAKILDLKETLKIGLKLKKSIPEISDALLVVSSRKSLDNGYSHEDGTRFNVGFVEDGKAWFTSNTKIVDNMTIKYHMVFKENGFFFSLEVSTDPDYIVTLFSCCIINGVYSVDFTQGMGSDKYKYIVDVFNEMSKIKTFQYKAFAKSIVEFAKTNFG